MAIILDGLVSSWVYLILAELKFDGVAVQSCDDIESTTAVYDSYDTSQL